MIRLIQIAVLAFLFGAGAAAANSIAGPAKVVDGDTLWVAGVKVRLNGVDAPERNTPLGRQATRAMKQIVRGKKVSCKLNGDKSYDRLIGICFAGEHDIGAVLIQNGFALDCRRFSGGRYRKLEPKNARSRLPQAKYCRK